MSEPSGRKRQRLNADTQKPPLLTYNENLILQQAASILSRVRRQQYGQGLTTPAPSVISASPDCVPPSLESHSEISPLVDNVSADSVFGFAHDFLPRGVGRHQLPEVEASALPLNTNGREGAWIVGTGEPAPVLSRLGLDSRASWSTDFPNITPHGTDPLLGTSCGLTHDVESSLIAGIEKPLQSNHQALPISSRAVQSTYYGTATQNGPCLSQSLFNAQSASNNQMMHATAVGHGMNTAGLDVSSALNSRRTLQSLTGQGGVIPGNFDARQYAPGLPAFYYSPDSSDIAGFGVASSLESECPTSNFSFSNTSPLTLWPSGSHPPQSIHSTIHSLGYPLLFGQNDPSGSHSDMVDDDWPETLSFWTPGGVSVPNLPAAQPAGPLTEQQVVLRGPSPHSSFNSIARLDQNQSQKPVHDETTLGIQPPDPVAPTVARILPNPGTNETFVFATSTTTLAHDGKGHRVRQPFSDLGKKEETGETRKIGACVRCRWNKIRCSSEDNEDGNCASCAKLSRPTLCKLPCFRAIITDSRLFDKGQHPQFRWSRRWSSWDVVEINTWASPEIKTITITQDVLGGSTLKIRCREYIPQDGDSLARTWKKNGSPVYYPRAPYAVLSMKETGNEIKKFVAKNIGSSIKYYIMEKKDELLSSTYGMAYDMVFRSYAFPKNVEGKRLLQEVFQLWVAIRMESQSERIVGEETLGMEPQNFDPSVSSYGTNSIPPIMSAQMEMMTTTQILQPLKKAVLKRLQILVKTNELKSWISIYLCLFVLLHSCSILTADENKQAKKYGLQTRYVFDTFIEELHGGAITMIYYFHYCNKGSHPFAPNWMTEENLALADLNAEQARFLSRSSELIKARLPEFERIRENKDFESDWYFVAQLYDQHWQPKHTL